MKLLILLVIMVGSGVAVKAQYENLMKRKPWNEAKLKMLLRDKLSKVNPLSHYKYEVPQQTKDGVSHIPITGAYIGDNGNGDGMYAMQPDNMPCLVPGKGFTSKMPVVGSENIDKSLLPLLQKGDKKLGE
ncbi:MAG: hypothetical protein M3040_16715 [Bacteroidota bacterium]|nr:hypothetical protein [Bacteroidota bacterium]